MVLDLSLDTIGSFIVGARAANGWISGGSRLSPNSIILDSWSPLNPQGPTRSYQNEGRIAELNCVLSHIFIPLSSWFTEKEGEN